jgi:hypothetical protein
MNARVTLIGVSPLLLPFLCPTQDVKLPMFFLRNDGGVGSEEINLTWDPNSERATPAALMPNLGPPHLRSWLREEPIHCLG